MKKVLSIVLFACITLGFTVSAANNPPEKKGFDPILSVPFSQIWNASLTSEKAKAIRSFKLTYRGSCEEFKGGVTNGIIVVRGKGLGTVRLDVYYPNNLFTVCCNNGHCWTMNKEDGATLIDKKDVPEVIRDFSTLQVPCMPNETYASPRFIKKVKIGNVNCKLYETKPLDGPSQVLRIWTDEKSGLVYQVEAEDKSGITAIAYRDYKDYNGIKLATSMVVSDAEGILKLKLSIVEWNIKISDRVFLPRIEEMSAETLAYVKKQMIAQDKLENPQKYQKIKQNEIAAAKRKINVLKIEIDSYEKEMQLLERTVTSNKKDMVRLASSTPPRRRSYRSIRHRGRSSIFGRSRNFRKHAIIEYSTENDAAKTRYFVVRKLLTQKRIQLEDAKADLEKLQQK